jgi:hypothetical protein
VPGVTQNVCTDVCVYDRRDPETGEWTGTYHAGATLWQEEGDNFTQTSITDDSPGIQYM